MRKGAVVSSAIIWTTLLFSASLQVMPLPPFIDEFLRPHWMLLTSLYWCLAMPHRFNIGSAFVAGLMLDVLWGIPMGINALAFGICGVLIAHQCQKIRSFSVWHQSFIFMLAALLYQWLTASMMSVIDGSMIKQDYYMACFITLLAWPWIFFTLRKTRRRLFLQ